MPHDTAAASGFFSDAHFARRRLTVQLAALLILFGVLAVSLYITNHFYGAGVNAQAVNSDTAINQELKAVLQTATPGDVDRITAALGRIDRDGRSIKVFFRPTNTRDASNLFYITSAPSVPASRLEEERAALQANGALALLDTACEGNPAQSTDIAKDEAPSVTSLHTSSGCWEIVITPAFSQAWRVMDVVSGIATLLIIGFAVLMATSIRRLAAVTAALETSVASPLRLAPDVDAAQPEATRPVSLPPFSIPADAAISGTAPESDDQPLVPVNLSSVVHAFADVQWIRLGSAGDRLMVEVIDGVVVEGREDVIEELLGNLVENAFETASVQGRVFVEVAVAREDDRRIAVLSVACKGTELEAGPGSSEARAASQRRSLAAERCARTLGASLVFSEVAHGGWVVLVKFPPVRFRR